jgi:hypothetical protein
VPGSVYHVFTNAIADGTNSSIVRPSDWNSSHALTLNAAVARFPALSQTAEGSHSGLTADGKDNRSSTCWRGVNQLQCRVLLAGISAQSSSPTAAASRSD